MNRIVICPYCQSSTEVYVDGYAQVMHRCDACGGWLGLRIVDVQIEVSKATLEKCS